MELVIQHVGRRARVGTLTRGDAGIAQTIAVMQYSIDRAVFLQPTASRLRTLAAELAADGATIPEFAASVWNWLRDHVRFERDPRGVELIRSPGDMLRVIDARGTVTGDCDDLATLGASIVAAHGLPPVLITVGRAHGRFEHVFFGVAHRDTVIPLDPQEGTPAGEWPPDIRRLRLWSLTVTPPPETEWVS